MTDNTLIAEFLGLKSLTDDKKQWCDLSGSTFLGTSAYYTHDLKFHETWEWLLPVLEKIRQIDPEIKFRIGIRKSKIYNKKIQGCNFFDKSNRSMLNMAYNVIVDYIKWYNNEHR